jgi:hypothetical protein
MGFFLDPIIRKLYIIGLLLLSACATAQHAGPIHEAERAFNRLRQENAYTYAPYEYFYASEYLKKAHEEAARSSYESALHYAETAIRICEIATNVARRHRDKKGY